MHPLLFRIPLPGWDLPWLGKVTSLPIYSYGVMLGLSIVVGWNLTLGLASRDFAKYARTPEQQDDFREAMANCYVITALLAIAGAKVLYILTNLSEFHGFSDLFALGRGGLVAYGGFLGGFVGSWLYLRSRGIKLLPWADWAVLSLATGLWLTRIGCYLYGCDFGKQLSPSAPAFLKNLGTFPHWPEGMLDQGTGSPAWFQHYEQHLVSLDSTQSLPVHPTQLYESLVGLALFGLLMLQRRYQRFRGQVFLLFTFAYGVCRYLLEILRDDAERGEYGPLMAEHVIVPMGLLLLGLAYVAFMARAIGNKGARLATQIAVMIPAVATFLALRPSNFVEASLVRLSTSQWVALFTGVAAAVAYGMFWNMAQAHPEQAMSLSAAAEQASEAEAEAEQPAPEKRRKRKKAKAEATASTGDEAHEANIKGDVEAEKEDGEGSILDEQSGKSPEPA